MRKVGVQKVSENSVVSLFSGSGSFVKIRAPGVGARAGKYRNDQNRKEGPRGPSFLPLDPSVYGFSPDFRHKGVVRIIPRDSVPGPLWTE